MYPPKCRSGDDQTRYEHCIGDDLRFGRFGAGAGFFEDDADVDCDELFWEGEDCCGAECEEAHAAGREYCCCD